MREGFHHVPYRSIPHQRRFSYLTRLFFSEAGYTSEELELRLAIVAARQSINFHEQLKPTFKWFDNDLSVALTNLHENAWFFSAHYQPKEQILLKDFYIETRLTPPILWPTLRVLMRNIGDYLIMRNGELDLELLNQPINFVLLDLVQLCKKLAIMPDPHFISQQLTQISHYLHKLELLINPEEGSDQLFLADCRLYIEKKIHGQFEALLHSQQLQNRLINVQQDLIEMAEQHYAILHFVLSEEPVNPHPYLYYFMEPPESNSNEFPPITLKKCALSKQIFISPRLFFLNITARDLDDCPEIKFIHALTPSIKSVYANSINELQQSLNFYEIIHRLLHLFTQTGEIFTVFQFRQNMHQLLKKLEIHIKSSYGNAQVLIEENDRLYHQQIQKKQDLQWWEKIFSNKVQEIANFLENQAHFSHFSLTTAHFQISKEKFLQSLNDVGLYLTRYEEEGYFAKQFSETNHLTNEFIETVEQVIAITASDAPNDLIKQRKTQADQKPSREDIDLLTATRSFGFFQSPPPPKPRQLIENSAQNTHNGYGLTASFSDLLLIPYTFFAIKKLISSLHSSAKVTMQQAPLS